MKCTKTEKLAGEVSDFRIEFLHDLINSYQIPSLFREIDFAVEYSVLL
jgi:hypothetical protein